MEIELLREEVFTIRANGKSVHGMRVVSEWEGLMKLQDTRGNAVIVAKEDGAFAGMFEMFHGEKLRKGSVVLASPAFLAQLAPDTTAEEK